jgi:hypothetical protein
MVHSVGSDLVTQDEADVFTAFKEYLDCRIRQLINVRLHSSDLQDSIETREAEENWIKQMEEKG